MPPDIDLLSICALLDWFDHQVLAALSDRPAAEVAALLASDLVEAAPEPAGAYRLREDTRREQIERIHAERPLDELAIHTCAFQHFLRLLQQPDASSQRVTNEIACFYHLGELRLPLTERREWETLASYVAAARAAEPQQPRHLHFLSFCEGSVAIRTKDYKRGETLLAELLDQPDLEDSLRVRVLNTLGHACWYQTTYDQAISYYRQIYDLALAIGDIPYQGHALINMSMVYKEIGNYEQALNLSALSLQIFRDRFDNYHEAHALYEIGSSAMHLGRWQVALAHFAEAITLHERLHITAGLANLYWNLGLLYHMLGDATQSEATYRQGLVIAESVEHGEPVTAMDLLLYLGFLLQTEGRWDEALDAYKRAIPLAEQIRNRHALALIHYRRGDVFKLQGQPEQALAAYRQALAAVEDLRGANPGEAIKIGLLGTTQQIYEAMVLLCLEQERPVEAFEYVEQARSRAFLDTLAQKSPNLYDAFAQPVATLADVQAQLPVGALLLEYFTTGVLPRNDQIAIGSAGYNISKIPPENTRLREHLILPPQTLIFAVTREGFAVHRAALDPNALRPQPNEPGPGRRFLRGRLLDHLHEQLIGPVAHLLVGRELLYLIPHGPLHYVPFMALRSAAGEYLLRAGGPAIAQAPSATVLLRTCLGRPPAQGEGLLALGYNDEGDNGLRFAEAEAEQIARLSGGQSWTGPAPKSQRLIAAGRQARWLHIAGHAIFKPHDPLDSELRLGAGDSLSARAIMRDLDLNVDLVTLSACTSGLSHVVPGDELLGLQRAFLYAGAPAVVCTLWEAADFVALLVMERFYSGLRQGHSAAVALRDALVALRELRSQDLAAPIARWRNEGTVSLAVQSELPTISPDQPESQPFADPIYWAPFMLIGRA